MSSERTVLVIARPDAADDAPLIEDAERVVFDDVPVDDLLDRIFAADVVLVD